MVCCESRVPGRERKLEIRSQAYLLLGPWKLPSLGVPEPVRCRVLQRASRSYTKCYRSSSLCELLMFMEAKKPCPAALKPRKAGRAHASLRPGAVTSKERQTRPSSPILLSSDLCTECYLSTLVRPDLDSNACLS